MATNRIIVRRGRKQRRRVGKGANAGSTAYELAQKLGILGTAKGLPSDLSTNRKYLRGFGKHK